MQPSRTAGPRVLEGTDVGRAVRRDPLHNLSVEGSPRLPCDHAVRADVGLADLLRTITVIDACNLLGAVVRAWPPT